MRRIGIDVGGTNTDAVLVSQGRVEAAVKVPTTADVTAGILSAMRLLREQAGDAHEVGAVMIGTTHFTNAVVQRRDLAEVAAVRIGAPATTALPPFCDWPEDLAALVAGGTWIVEGGHDFAHGLGFGAGNGSGVLFMSQAKKLGNRHRRFPSATAKIHHITFQPGPPGLGGRS